MKPEAVDTAWRTWRRAHPDQASEFEGQPWQQEADAWFRRGCDGGQWRYYTDCGAVAYRAKDAT